MNIEIKVLGMTEEAVISEVKKSGMSARICRRDKQYFIVTRDLKHDRVNIYLEDGLVVKATIG